MTKILPFIFRTLQRHLIDVCKMIMYLKFNVFSSNSIVFGKFSFFNCVIEKNGTKKVGHIYKFISCTGLAYTGRSLFSIALDSVILNL